MTDAPPIETDTELLRERVRAASELLESIDADRGLLAQLTPEEQRRFLHATRIVSDPDPRARRRLVKASKRQRKAALAQHDDKVLAETGIRELRRKPVFTTPNYYLSESRATPLPDSEPMTSESRHCYVCKEHYQTVHHFYDQLCPACAELNFFKRTELADLSGRVALLTGGRVKIGYQAGLKLLRAGARLLVTTRFPRDAAQRFAREADFEAFADRLQIHGLDLRHCSSVELFARFLNQTLERLDIVINNAAQTVRRPPGFYQHLLDLELGPLSAVDARARRLLHDHEACKTALSGSSAQPLQLG
ncbi:MAG TPA: SDR family NAD(P)-dependent oxidoreductase, partial [Thermoanaerobaculia bacterium]|nr:SDR family NAD(P)-dependent oxidoreductase [Thermoanaerobaculia bacterium]